MSNTLLLEAPAELRRSAPAGRLHLVNVRLVLPESIVERGSLLLSGGLIEAICPGPQADTPTYDCHGHTLIPGLVDLHCDALEKELQPRPGVVLPLPLAMTLSDRANALAGITTPYHAISFSGAEFGLRNDLVAADCVRRMRRRPGLVDHRIHLRYEITHRNSVPVLEELLREGFADLLAFNDHSPGQGQFRTDAAWSQYMQSTYRLDQTALDRLRRQKLDGRQRATARVAWLASLARRTGLPLAVHDADDPGRLADDRALGIQICEFPINLATAQSAYAAGMVTVFGAPNIVRGVSQSGNLRAIEAVRAGCCSCLCSDYHPPSLLRAVFLLPSLAGLDLPAAVALATRNPALAGGLTDRGQLAPGRRADLVLVGHDEDCTSALAVWRAGRRVVETSHELGAY